MRIAELPGSGETVWDLAAGNLKVPFEELLDMVVTSLS